MWIGLTGGIATGKSTAAKILKDLGVPVVDADALAHDELNPGSESYLKIVQYFGEVILHQNGTILREELARIIFNDPQARLQLEAIIHPKVQEKVKKFRKEQQSRGQLLAVYDVPLLFEKKLESQFDGVLLIDCEEHVQLERLKQRNQLTTEQAQLRMNAQLDMQEKRNKARWIIDNNSSRKELEKQLNDWLQRLRALPLPPEG